MLPRIFSADSSPSLRVRRASARIAGALAVLFFSATSVWAGNEILVARRGVNDVMQVPFLAVGPQSQFAGGLTSPTSIRLGPNRCVYVVDVNVTRYFPDGTPDVAFNTAMATYMANNGHADASDVAFDADDNMYVALSTSGRVIKYTPTNTCGVWTFTSCELFTAFDGGLGQPSYLLFHPGSGNLLIADFVNHQVLAHNKDCAPVTTPSVFIPAGSNGLDTPENMAFGHDGNLYISSYGSGQVLRFNAAGAVIPGAFAPAAGEITLPHGLAFGPDGKLYVGERAAPPRIVRYGVTPAGAGTYDSSFSIASGDPHSFLFRQTGVGTLEDALVSYQSDNSIRRYDMTSGELIGDGSFVASGLGDLSYAHSIRMGPEGRIYAISLPPGSAPQGIKRYRWDGTYVDTFITIGSGGLQLPEDLAFGPGPNSTYPTQDCDVYVADYAAGVIRKYDRKTGAYGGVWADQTDQISGPDLIMFHPTNHDMYVTDRGTSRVVRLRGDNGNFVAKSSVDTVLEGIDAGPGGDLFVASNLDQVYRYAPTLGAPLGVFASTNTNPQGNFHGVAFGPDGNLYVTDRGGSTTRVYAFAGPNAQLPDMPGMPLVSNGGIFHDTGTCGPSLPFMILFRPTIPVDNVPFAEPGTEFCAGDDLDPVVTTNCPCMNFGDREHGCQNSHLTGGALLTAGGEVFPSDTILLEVVGATKSGLCIFLQGTTTIPAGVVYGDGIRCIGGSLKRLSVKNAHCGSAIFPDAAIGDPLVSIRSAVLGDPIPSGASRYYQVYYRDPDPNFCPQGSGGNTYNISNAYAIPW